MVQKHWYRFLQYVGNANRCLRWRCCHLFCTVLGLWYNYDIAGTLIAELGGIKTVVFVATGVTVTNVALIFA